MSIQTSIDRLNSIKERIRTNLVAQGITVPADTVLADMAEQILSVAGEPGISATHSWDGTVLTVTSASGSSSADLKGPRGEPLTIVDFSLSTEDGGNNTITFSDGTMVTIQNGRKGNDYTLTSSDKTDIAQQAAGIVDVSGKLDKSGGTMTGPLILADDPENDMEAATKKYVDSKPSGGATIKIVRW
jgi:hypothetical protein